MRWFLYFGPSRHHFGPWRPQEALPGQKASRTQLIFLHLQPDSDGHLQWRRNRQEHLNCPYFWWRTVNRQVRSRPGILLSVLLVFNLCPLAEIGWKWQGPFRLARPPETNVSLIVAIVPQKTCQAMSDCLNWRLGVCMRAELFRTPLAFAKQRLLFLGT